jgi:hypothetical protein
MCNHYPEQCVKGTVNLSLGDRLQPELKSQTGGDTCMKIVWG